ncbi:MAG: hypothetical protein GXP27_17555 [Planctomycetes bacterium]|nr:hypothetical protein [Planctomycetota bacterium]
MVAATLSGTVRDPLNLTVTDVTGMRRVQVSVDGHRPAADVASSVAQRMDLQRDTAYSFRDDRRARMLLDDVAIGQQVSDDQPSETVVLIIIPKAHLG